MNLHIMLVDDNDLFRDAMCMFLNLQEDIACTLEVACADDVLALYKQGHVDVVCMDVGMPGMDGAELTRQILAYAPEARVVGLSGLTDWRTVAQMVSAGALGYVIKGSASVELLNAIRAASQNSFYFDTALAIYSVNDLRGIYAPE